KNNLYRSLHTTVRGPDDRSVEVLIRTDEMHQLAEYGIAAHFRYPKSLEAMDMARADQLDWLRRVLDFEQETADATQFLASLRCDLSETQIQVFADGRQVVLPAGATPVDLAYELGVEKGDHCLAAAVNGRLAPLSSELEDGDVVEIFTEAEGNTGPEVAATPTGPHRDWLSFVKSSHAQMQIKRWFSDHDEPGITIADKVRLGMATIGLALRRHDRGLSNDQPLRQLADEMGYPDLEAMLVAVVDRTISPDTVADQLVALVDRRD
ncbi:MAG TPA: TGS domain-containing protein, partial [Asanoa sp.]